MNHFRGLFIGLTTIDIQYFVDSFPESNKKIKTDPPRIQVGGPATNAAVAFAQLNGHAYLASGTGQNSFSKIIDDDFRTTKIKHFDLFRGRAKNPVLSTVVTSRYSGDRNIFTHTPEKLSATFQIDKLITNVKPNILLLDGFYSDFALSAAIAGQNFQIPVVMDCGSWKPQHESLIKNADIIICSEDFYPPGCTSSDDVFTFLKNNKIKQAAISRGEQNILYYDNKKYGEIEIAKTNVTDTLAAGDFLHGAFCFHYLKENKTFELALKKASKLATRSCKYSGTRDWLNHRN